MFTTDPSVHLFLIWQILKRFSNMLCKKREQSISYLHKRIMTIGRRAPPTTRSFQSTPVLFAGESYSLLIRDKSKIYVFSNIVTNSKIKRKPSSYCRNRWAQQFEMGKGWFVSYHVLLLHHRSSRNRGFSCAWHLGNNMPWICRIIAPAGVSPRRRKSRGGILVTHAYIKESTYSCLF